MSEQTPKRPILDLATVVREVIAEFPEQVAEYRKGRPLLGFLLGQVMKRTGGLVRADEVQAALRKALAE